MYGSNNWTYAASLIYNKWQFSTANTVDALELSIFIATSPNELYIMNTSYSPGNMALTTK